jgi:proteasome lid subunit RPN8/RPN11
MSLRLPHRERRRLHDRAFRAQQRDQSEVCGAVVSDSTGRCRLVFLVNQSDRPGRFDVRRADLREVSRSLADSSERVMAVFHSHARRSTGNGT